MRGINSEDALSQSCPTPTPLSGSHVALCNSVSPMVALSSSEIIWRLYRVVLGVPIPVLNSGEWRNSKQNFYNKYHTASSSLCDIQWFVKGTKRTSKPMKCGKVLEQTTEKIFSQSSLLVAQLDFSNIWFRTEQHSQL